jgi:hypothetical protein
MSETVPAEQDEPTVADVTDVTDVTDRGAPGQARRKRPAAPAVAAPNGWVAPQPRELPELRSRMVEFTASSRGMLAISTSVNTGNFNMLARVRGTEAKFTPGAIAAPIMCALEKQRLEPATLFYASDDMSSLAVAAAQTPPIERFSPHRMPADQGLMVFKEPIGGYTTLVNKALPQWGIARPDLTITTPIVGVSWSRWSPASYKVSGHDVLWYSNSLGGIRQIPRDFNGVWFTFYCSSWDKFGELDPDEPISRQDDGTILTAADMAAGDRTGHGVPQLGWDNEMVVPWGADLSEPPVPDTTAGWLHVVYTAWQLITQKGGKNPVVEVEEIQPDRAHRRRDAREGITSPSAVRIVRVHSALRPSHQAYEQDTAQWSGRREASHSYRWPVKPHRRSVCHNTRGHADGDCEHFDTIIGWHVNGPRDKPLRLDNRVYLWDDQPDESA